MKYKLTEETKNHYGKTLYRIQALKDFGAVKKGDLGGFVEKESNLSHEGLCWVYGDARVSGNAKVYGDARVFGNAWVYGNAKVYGDARVYGDAEVSGNAVVYGDARVYGNAKVYGDARVSFGECTEKSINLINLCQYNITAYNKYIKVGCKEHTVDEWKKLLKENKDLYLDECENEFEHKMLRKTIKLLIKKLEGDKK